MKIFVYMYMCLQGDSLGIPHHTSDSGSALTPSKDSVRSLELYASDRMQ